MKGKNFDRQWKDKIITLSKRFKNHYKIKRSDPDRNSPHESKKIGNFNSLDEDITVEDITMKVLETRTLKMKW